MVPFFCTVRDKLEEILPPTITDVSEKDHFRLLKDPGRMGVRILEQRLCTDFLRKHRLPQNPNDLGNLKGRVADRIGHLGLFVDDLTLTFATVDRVGCDDPDGASGGGKFALLPDPDDPLYKRLIEAHEIVVEEVGAGGPYKGFTYPDEYVYRPHLTVVQIYRGASNQQVDSCEEALRAIVEAQPVTAPVDRLEFLPR